MTSDTVVPVGFLVLLLVIVMVMFYDLFKQSIFFYHLDRMRVLEDALNEAGNGQRLFDFAGGWPSWFRRTHAPIANGFFAVFYLIIVGFPCAILYLQDYVPWLWGYAGLAVVLLTAHALVAARVLTSLEDGGA